MVRFWLFRWLSQFDAPLVLFGLLVTALAALMLETYVVIPYSYAMKFSHTTGIVISVGFFVVTTVIWMMLSKQGQLDWYVSELEQPFQKRR
jgi:hypothetical protein